MNTVRTRSGFTLIELIIYIAITSLVVVSLMNVMITVFETREQTESISELQQSIRLVADRISNTFVDALGIDKPKSVLFRDEGVLTLVMSGSTTVFSLQNGSIFVGEERITPLSIVYDQFQIETVDTSSIKLELHAVDSTPDETGKLQEMGLETTLTLRQ